jgi:hypothetical protein
MAFLFSRKKENTNIQLFRPKLSKYLRQEHGVVSRNTVARHNVRPVSVTPIGVR